MIKAKYALVCESIPNSLNNGISLNKHEPIDMERARAQHSKYLELIEMAGVNLVKIKAQELYPDCVFVEDTAIAVKNRVLITNLAAVSRRGETEQIAATFESLAARLNLKLGYVKDKQQAFIDGGDCLFTGREFIVGLSTRTNQHGVRELGEFFDNIPVISCRVEKNLHLKSVMSMLDDDVILISSCAEADSLLKQIETQSKFYEHYRFVRVSCGAAANVLSFNNRIIAPAQYKAQCQHVPELADNSKLVWAESDEFEKIDGALTCRSVFFDDGN